MSKKVFILILVVTLISLVTRSIYTQHKYYKLSEHQSGLEKVKSLEKVILLYLPFSPYNDKAVNGILEECFRFSQNDEKLYCFETLRSSLIQIKSFNQPYEDTINRINPIIAKLRSQEMINWDFNKYTNDEFKKFYEAQIKLLTYDNTPSTFWSVMVGLSLIGWISAQIFLIWKGIGENVNLLNTIIGLLSFIAFFSLWILGLYLA